MVASSILPILLMLLLLLLLDFFHLYHVFCSYCVVCRDRQRHLAYVPDEQYGSSINPKPVFCGWEAPTTEALSTENAISTVMSANVILSCHDDIAWCAKLVKFLDVIGVEDGNGSCLLHMNMRNPPGIASSMRCLTNWAMDIRQAE
jgi:hypothetical protein